jgi:hypothetical protein
MARTARSSSSRSSMYWSRNMPWRPPAAAAVGRLQRRTASALQSRARRRAAASGRA